LTPQDMPMIGYYLCGFSVPASHSRPQVRSYEVDSFRQGPFFSLSSIPWRSDIYGTEIEVFADPDMYHRFIMWY
jgi:hypothetical protein